MNNWPDPTPETLDLWASRHVRYEAQMLVAGAVEFISRYPVMPASDGFKEPTIDDALVEATSVHIRLLDEFLVGRGRKDTIKAQHWVPNWSTASITDRVRQKINTQVAHLSSARKPAEHWDIRSHALSCCQQLNRFLDEVERRSPGRSAAFDGARKEVRRGLAEVAS